MVNYLIIPTLLGIIVLIITLQIHHFWHSSKGTLGNGHIREGFKELPAWSRGRVFHPIISSHYFLHWFHLIISLLRPSLCLQELLYGELGLAGFESSCMSKQSDHTDSFSAVLTVSVLDVNAINCSKVGIKMVIFFLFQAIWSINYPK